MSAPDPRLAPVRWAMPDQRSARRRSLLIAAICILLGGWYLSWLLRGERIGALALYIPLIAAESFNLIQAVGFWWTCSRQRLRPQPPRARAGAAAATAVDVLIPAYDEPVAVIEPTVAAAMEIRGGDVRVWLLDDGNRDELEALAARHGAGYLRRPEHTGAKAGNLNHALTRTEAPLVAVLDCDHVPHPDFLELTAGHLAAGVAFVQTPQYYANAEESAVAGASAAQQSLFFGPISRGKDGLGSVFCCGTNVLFRRAALEDAGGFPEETVTEDFELSVRLHERGWRSVYVPEVVASGLGPEDMASYVSQQQRWARGCLSAIPAVLRARLPLRQRLQYLLSATYFLSGWTLLIYISLPVIRMVFGAQPLAAASADQFLLHFAPYYVAALGAVAIAGFGTYTFHAFALAASSFWIHIQATVTALLRRPARFVVTPKEGARERQPRAVWPALAAIAVLAAASGYGLARSQGPATLNNVAFAGLHAFVLLAGAAPALRLGRSPALTPEAPRRPRPGRRWPRPVVATALAAALAAPIAVGVVGSRGLSDEQTLSEKAHSSAEAFLDRYLADDGRVVRHDQRGDTVSEGQAYAMLLAVALDDQARFKRAWSWAERNLRGEDGLLAFHWKGGAVASPEPASDADLDAARALVLAGERFGSEQYTAAGVELGQALLERETETPGSEPVLVAGPWARGTPAVINPSYFSPRAYADLAEADKDERWAQLAATSRTLTDQLTGGGKALPPDWATVGGGPAPEPIADPGRPEQGASAGAPASADAPDAAASGLDAARVAVRLAESCVPEDQRLAAGFWDRYRERPGATRYRLDGSPAGDEEHAVSLVAAAAAAKAAGSGEEADELLDRADELEAAQPTYYGSAWVALGRVMLGSDALGRCRD